MRLKYSLPEIEKMGYDTSKLNHKHIPVQGQYLDVTGKRIMDGRLCRICRIGGDVIDFG